jgi:hypothetical protein
MRRIAMHRFPALRSRLAGALAAALVALPATLATASPQATASAGEIGRAAGWTSPVTAWLLELLPQGGDGGDDVAADPSREDSVGGTIGSGMDPNGNKNESRPSSPKPAVGHER